jgi:hypothetical protein
MTIAYVKNADGSGATVQNTFRDSGGTLHTLLSDDFTDSDGNPFLVFRDQLVVVPVGTSNQVFHVTDTRTFLATVDKELNMTCPVQDEFCAIKDPGEILDYTCDYTDVLAESDPPDSITASTWTLLSCASGKETTLSILDDTQFTDTTATVWMGGGSITGLSHELTNHITCASGRQYERTITLWIQSK